MSPNRAFNLSRGRYIHVSAPIIPNPARAIEMATTGYSILPEHIVGPRTMFFKRRKQGKREMRRVFTFAAGTKLYRLASPVVRCTKKVTP